MNSILFMYYVTAEDSTQAHEKHIAQLWRYDLQSNECSQMKNIGGEFHFLPCDYVLPADEKCVVILGRDTDRDCARDCIAVMRIVDEEHYEIWKSAVNIPGRPLVWLDNHRYALTNDTVKCKLLSMGWIRRGIRLVCPSDIVRMIEKYYKIEMFHFIGSQALVPENESNHQMIPLDEILSSKYSSSTSNSTLQP